MKKTLLIIALIASASLFAQTNLVLNGTADEHTTSTSDNADSWDMTPNSTIKDELNATVDSPYAALWKNSDLEDYLEATYNADGVDEQPGSTSSGTYDGANKTRGVKLYDDGDPVVSASTRRLYQKIVVEAGAEYTFSIQSRSNTENIPSEVFMLNEEIVTELGLENKAEDTRVDAYKEITDDFNSSGGSESNNTFTTTTFDFTASTTTVVIYVRAPLAMGDAEVYFDNISLVKKATASTNDVFSSKISVYPNPANDFLQISSDEIISEVAVYNLIGKRVISSSKLVNNRLDVSNLSKGVYVLKVISNDLVGSRKIIIE